MMTEPAKVFQLNADSPTALALAKHFQLQPQDVVFVGPANITRWNRFISQLLQSANVVGIGAAAEYNLGRRSEEHTSELQSQMRISYAVSSSKNNTTLLYSTASTTTLAYITTT